MTDLTLYEVSPEDAELVYTVSPESEDQALLSLTLSFPQALVTQVAFRTRSTKDMNCRLALVEYKVADSQALQPVKTINLPREDDHLGMEYADGILHFPAVCVTTSLKLTFECDRPEWDDLDQEVAAISNRMSHDRHWAERIFKDTFTSVGVVGYSLLAAPDPLHSLTLINLSCALADEEEAKEACYLVGLALIGEKKCTQAAEFLRRAEGLILKGVNFPRPPTTGQRPVNTVATLKIWSAIRIEILVADGFAQGGLFKQQILALQRAVELYQNGAPMAQCQGSLVACLVKLHPHLSRILLKCLSETGEPIRMAALRSLRVIVELQGCSLGSHLSMILKSVVRAYHLTPSTAIDVFNNSTMTNLSFTDIILKDDAPLGSANEYIKLIQTMRTLLSDWSPQLLQKLFAEGVTQLTLMEMKKELKVEILKLATRIAELMQGDLEVDIAVIKHVFALKETEEYQEPASALWGALCAGVLPHYTGQSLLGVLEWLREALTPDCGVETATEGLQLVALLVRKSPGVAKPDLARMKPTIECWVQFALSTPGQLPLFQLAWSCMEGLAAHIPRLDLARILKPILERTSQSLSRHGLNSDHLLFLKSALAPVQCKESIAGILNTLLAAISAAYPGRNESLLLEVMVQVTEKLGNYLLIDTAKTVIETLFDEQIVVSDGVSKARGTLATICLSPGLLEASIQMCLLDNAPTVPPNTPQLAFAVSLLEKCGQAQMATVSGTMEQLCNACDLLLANDDPNLKITAIRCLKAIVKAGINGKTPDRIDTAMLVIGSLRAVVEAEYDVDMQFLALQLLYQVFSDLVPASSEKRNSEYRANEIIKLWSSVTKCVDSGWSRINAYAAALLRNWAWGCSNNTRVSKYIFSYLLTLSSAKDCFRRELFLGVLANLLGLGSAQVHVPLTIWELVFNMQFDWQADLRLKARTLILKCAPKDAARELASRQQQKLALLVESSQYELTNEDEYDDSTLDYAFKEDTGSIPDLQSLFKQPPLPATLRDTQCETLAKPDTVFLDQIDLKVDLDEPPLETVKVIEVKRTEIQAEKRKEEKPQPPPESKSEEYRIRPAAKPVPEEQIGKIDPVQEYCPVKTELQVSSRVVDSKRSPRTPRKSLEQELELALKPHPGVPPSELMTKIYLQRPDMTSFRRKTKSASLTSTSGRTRKLAVRPLRPSPVFKEH